MVDDDPALLAATARLLESAGYEVCSAADGETALAVVRSRTPGLALVDADLPGVDGFETCRRIKAETPGNGPFVAILTGSHITEDHRVQGLECGADDYLARPISDRELLARVALMLRLRASEGRVRALAQSWKTTVDSINDAILLTDAEFNIVKYNRAAAQAFAQPGQEMIGQKCCYFVHGTRDPIPGCPLKDVGQTKRRQTLTFEQGGRWLEVSAYPILDGDGLFIGTTHIILDITARQQAEAALRKSEDRYRDLVEHVHDLICTHDLQGRLLSVNNAALELTGYTADEIIGKNMRDLLPAVNSSHFDAYLAAIQKDGIAAGLMTVQTRSGEQRTWEYYNTLRSEDVAEPVVRGYAHDVTAQRRTEKALRTSEKLLNHSQEMAAIGSFVWNLQADSLTWSKNMYAIHGVDEAGFAGNLGEASNQFIHPDDRERVQAEIERMVQAGRVWSMEFRILRPDGQERVMRSSGEFEFDRGGKPAKCFGVHQDITASKRAEEKLHATIAQLSLLWRASESLVKSLHLPEILQTLTETAAQLLDLDSSAIYLSEGDMLYLGATTPPLPGDFPESLRWARLADHPHIQRAIASSEAVILPDAQAAELTEAERAVCEIRGLRTITYLPMMGVNRVLGALILGTVGAARSITEDELDACRALSSQAAMAIENARLYQAVKDELAERQRAEQEVQKLNAELEGRVEERTRELREAQEQLVRHEKLAVLGQLAGGVGHELRNPLAVINNAVYFLKLTRSQADEKMREYLDLIEREVHNADKIINDLLDFSRVKSVGREPASVADMLARTLERFPAPPGVQVTLDLPEGLPPVHVDPRQVEQALGNLVVNAYQAMPQGGQLLVLSCVEGSVFSEQCSVDDRQWVQIVIKDTGVGIPPGSLDKIFEPLFTTKVKGIGLGLPVSRKLAKANGGRIEVESEVGKGSIFTVWLPVHNVTARVE
ncbi:MAG: PAS domain S-box protein [Chloroflexota bacterium]